jgi:hypothetical protein
LIQPVRKAGGDQIIEMCVAAGDIVVARGAFLVAVQDNFLTKQIFESAPALRPSTLTPPPAHVSGVSFLQSGESPNQPPAIVHWAAMAAGCQQTAKARSVWPVLHAR